MRAIVVALCVALPNPAYCLTGAELYKFCQEPKGSAAELSCHSYIAGFVDGTVTAHYDERGSRKFCNIDDGINKTEARTIIEKFLKEHPGIGAKEAGILASLALYEVFGCKQ